MKFYIGLHQPSDAKHFGRCMVSVNRLWNRRSGFESGEWIMDSGAFTEISRHGRFRREPNEYAAVIRHQAKGGRLIAAVSQDVMCEPFIIRKTGLSVLAHQAITIKRYDRLLREDCGGVYIMPVLQGYTAAEYVRHIALYGPRLAPGVWVGVGSVCKRQGDVAAIEAVLIAIKDARPDLHLHGFGVKITALQSSIVRDCLYSADSMAWSYAARRQGRSANDWREAHAFTEAIQHQRIQPRGYQYAML